MHARFQALDPASGLLAADEPRPYRLLRPDAETPIIIVCDHATRFVPRALRGLGLSEEDLSRHIAWDIGIAETVEHLSAELEATAILSHFSRIVIDPNRKLTDPTLVPELSDGTIIPGNRDLGDAERQMRIETFFRPYHDAIANFIDARLHVQGPQLMISMHSFTPVMRGFHRPWEIGVLWNRDPRVAVPLLGLLRAERLAVGDNEPYTGADGHGYTLHAHAEPRGLPHVLIELRQDIIAEGDGPRLWAARLAKHFREILSHHDILHFEVF